MEVAPGSSALELPTFLLQSLDDVSRQRSAAFCHHAEYQVRSETGIGNASMRRGRAAFRAIEQIGVGNCRTRRRGRQLPVISTPPV